MNKRHYEHTLPNIRGSLSNTYEGKEGEKTRTRPNAYGSNWIHNKEDKGYAPRKDS